MATVLDVLGVVMIIVGLLLILVQIIALLGWIRPQDKNKKAEAGPYDAFVAFMEFAKKLPFLAAGLLLIYAGLRTDGVQIFSWDCPKQSTAKQDDAAPKGK
jgi:hypothetical protein